MLTTVNICVDGATLGRDVSERIIACAKPVFSWGGNTDVKDNFQIAYRLVVEYKGEILWDTGVVCYDVSRALYDGKPLPYGSRIDFSLQIAGNDGELCSPCHEYFYIGVLNELPDAQWICASEDLESVPVYFNRDFFWINLCLRRLCLSVLQDIAMLK